MAAGGGGDRGRKETATWAVTTVCAVFVIISIIMEHGIHSLECLVGLVLFNFTGFKKKQKKAMSEALEKIKAGEDFFFLNYLFLCSKGDHNISLRILIAFYVYFRWGGGSRVDATGGNSMLPCKEEDKKKGNYDSEDDDGGGQGRRRLLVYAQDVVARRALAAASGDTDHCAKNFANDATRFRFAHQTSFVGLSQIPGARWVNAFQMAYFLWTSMGSHMKQAIFEEQTKKAIMKWRKLAKDKKKKLGDAGKDKDVASGLKSNENTSSRGTSPLHLLHNHHHHHSSATDLPSVLNSPTTSYPSDAELSEIKV
ncbi:Mlo-related protein, partial [Dillenia turbinata]